MIEVNSVYPTINFKLSSENKNVIYNGAVTLMNKKVVNFVA